MSPEAARELNLLQARDALRLLPNVTYNQTDTVRAASFTVRGSRELPFHELTGGRTGVGYYLDDVPVADAYGRDLPLLSTAAISFYKGPQGSAFGVPHSMGVMEVNTRAPGPAWEAEASYTYGSFEFNQVLARVSGPLASNLFLGLDGVYSRDDGWFEDRITGNDYGSHELAGGRAWLRWLPAENLEISLLGGISAHDDDPVVYVPSDRTVDPFVLFTSPDAYADGNQHYESLQALWHGQGWQIKSITSHRDSDFDDNDPALALEIFFPGSLPRSRQQDVRYWTQELRLESTDPDADWRWRAGGFLAWRDSSLDHFILGLGPWEGRNLFEYQQDDYALYGEVTRPVGSFLELSAGLRLQTTMDHTLSSFEPTAFAASLGGVPFSLDREENYGAALPMAAARWKWSDTHRSYFRFSSGFQPGGLQVAVAGSTDYASETSWHYELGHDASFLGQAVQLHGAAFYTDYRDYQSFQFNPAGYTIFNAERAQAVGVEGELRVRPCVGLELFAGAGYTDARYDEFDTSIGSFDGNRIGRIPIGTVNLGGVWRASWGGLARLDWRWHGSTWFDDGNTVQQEAYSVLDVRLGYERGRWGFYVFGRNLLDEIYYTNIYLFQGAPAATPGTPRFLGLEMRASL